MKYYVCITPFFPTPESFRGPYVLDQVKAIARNSDFRTVVMLPAPFYSRGATEDYEVDGVKVYRFTDYTLPSYVYPNVVCDRLTYRSFRRKLRELHVNPQDIVVCHAHVTRNGSTAILLKQDFSAVKTVIQHHGFDVMSVTDGRLAGKKWHQRLCVRYGVGLCNAADLNVGVSRRTLDYVKAQPGIALKDSYVLYNGVDTSMFHPAERKNRNEVFTIGCVANFWELKDQMTLIKAVEQLIGSGLTDIKVIFVGSGYTRENCEKYIRDKRLDPYFEFRTEVMHDRLPDFYRSLDLFVLPSYWEAFGCVYTEAYACGVPFIGVKGQGISEIVPAESADRWLIEKGDYVKLAELIRRTKEHPGEPQLLSAPIDIDTLVREYLKYIS